MWERFFLRTCLLIYRHRSGFKGMLQKSCTGAVEEKRVLAHWFCACVYCAPVYASARAVYTGCTGRTGGWTREAMACTHSFTTGAQGLRLCYRAYTILQLWTTAFSGWVKRCKTMFCQLSLPFPHRLLYYSVQLRTKTFRTQSCASTTRFVIARQEAVFSNLCLCGCHQISGILLENGSRTSHLM